ncbi:hypothetical protein CMI37_14285 [Candidatus Pacearchaeota archaeon]|nr:hypothetical protein [Candidatus Pacearchaeota archaeon]
MGLYYEPGEYWAEILNHGLTESRKLKTPQLFVTMRVLGTVNPEEPDKYDPVQRQYERTIYKPLTDKTVAFVMDFLVAIGFTGERYADFDLLNGGSCDLRGNSIKVYCEHETYNAKEQERWNLSRGSRVQPMEQTAVSRLDSLFGQELRSRMRGKKKNSKKETPPVNDKEPTPSQKAQKVLDSANEVLSREPDDNIPF